MGYHSTSIKRGEIGEISKIREELEELEDAVHQGALILEFVELSDLIGAIQEYLRKHHPYIDLLDLTRMAALTKRAFEDGSRK